MDWGVSLTETPEKDDRRKGWGRNGDGETTALAAIASCIVRDEVFVIMQQKMCEFVVGLVVKTNYIILTQSATAYSHSRTFRFLFFFHFLAAS